jgi:hypothetical protein
MDSGRRGFPIELVGPQDYVALGGSDLRLRYRLWPGPDPDLSSGEAPSPAGLRLSIQLTFVEDHGRESFVATTDLPTLPTSLWNEVRNLNIDSS